MRIANSIRRRAGPQGLQGEGGVSSEADAFLEETRLGPRTRVLVEGEEIPDIPRLERCFRE